MSATSLPTDVDLARIRSRARELGLSNADLASRIGRTEHYLRCVLSGQIPMSGPVRTKLVEVLGLAEP